MFIHSSLSWNEFCTALWHDGQKKKKVKIKFEEKKTKKQGRGLRSAKQMWGKFPSVYFPYALT